MPTCAASGAWLELEDDVQVERVGDPADADATPEPASFCTAAAQHEFRATPTRWAALQRAVS
jgi:hypothetical protein